MLASDGAPAFPIDLYLLQSPTLARDIKRMNGGPIRQVCPVDMFPQTAEIEWRRC